MPGVTAWALAGGQWLRRSLLRGWVLPPPVPSMLGKPAQPWRLRAACREHVSAAPEAPLPDHTPQLSQNAAAAPHTIPLLLPGCSPLPPGKPPALIPTASHRAGAGVQEPARGRATPCTVRMSPCRQGCLASPGWPEQPRAHQRLCTPGAAMRRAWEAAGVLGWQFRCCSCPPLIPRGANELLRDLGWFRASASPFLSWDPP